MNIYTVHQWVLLFYLYCFMGWIWESCYVSLKNHNWVNRGFLKGPLLPIYGSGAIVVLISTLVVQKNLVLVFIIGMIAATILEYITGALMEKLFHVRYWDYTTEPFNINGHVCLLCSLAWGVFSVLLVRFVNPPIEYLINNIPDEILEISNEVANAKIKYEELFKIIETKKNIYLFLDSAQSIILNKNNFKLGSCEQCIEFLKDKLKEKYKIYTMI